MRTIRTTTISILALSLLAGSSVGVAAQDDEPPTTTIEDFGASVPAAGDVVVQCDPDPQAPDVVSAERTACDAPIEFAIAAVDVLATEVAVRCISDLQSSLPGYAKDWKVLGSLTTLNPIAVAIALGSAAEGDLRECGLQGIIAGLPASEQVRGDLQKVVDAVRKTEEYLSLQAKMRKVMSLPAEPLDAGTLARDVGDAYLDRREVEGLGNDISSLGKGLAKHFQGAAEDVAVLEGGVGALGNLVEAARSALQDQEELAEEIRASSRADVAECSIEAADEKLVRAEQAAQRALLQSHQAIANAGELRVCINKRMQDTLPGVPNLRRAVGASGRPDLARQLKEFDDLELEIVELERKAIPRQSVLLANIGRQCRLLHDEAEEIDRTVAEYEKVVRSIEDDLADPALCSVEALDGKFEYLESIEDGDCDWRLPRQSRGVPMSETLDGRRAAHRRNIQVERQLFETLESDAIKAIEAGAHERAAQFLDSMDGMTRSPCLDSSVVAPLRNRLGRADVADGSAGTCSPAEIAGTYEADWGPIECRTSGAGLECCYGSNCEWELRLAIADSGEKLKGVWDHNDGSTGPVEFGLSDRCELDTGEFGYEAGKLTRGWSVHNKTGGGEAQPVACERFCVEWVCSTSGTACSRFGNSCDGDTRRDTRGGNFCGKGCKTAC